MNVLRGTLTMALMLSGCAQPGSIRARFVLGWDAPASPAQALTPAALRPSFAPADDQPTTGEQSPPNPTAPAVLVGGSGGGSGGGGTLAVPSGPGARVATTGLFNSSWLAGQAPGGPAGTTPSTSLVLRELAGIADSPAGEVYVCDRGKNQILAFPAAGLPAVLCGDADGSAGFWGDDLPAVASALAAPTGLARDDTNGVLYVADAGNRRIRHFMPGGRIYTLAGGGIDAADVVMPATDARLGEVHGLALDSLRNFYFSEWDTGKVRRIAATGQLETLAMVSPGNTGAIACNRAGSRIWVAHGDTIDVLDPMVTPVAISRAFSAPGRRITALAFDQVDTLYFIETDAMGNGGTQVKAAVLDAAGRLATGRAAEKIAGSGVTGDVEVDYTIALAPLADARQQALAGQGACSLYIDLHQAASPTVLSGILYVGSSFRSTDATSRWAQLARMEPLP